MGVYTEVQIKSIIADNPNKHLIKKARETSAKLVMHLYGTDLSQYILRDTYFENEDAFKSRSEQPVSNKDMFQRLLQQEDVVFTARGGANRYNLPEAREKELGKVLANIQYNLSLRNWVRNFALPAYRSDPMGVIFMEIGQADPESTQPKCYPTYKSSACIYDYKTKGRELEYVCFELKAHELERYGVSDTSNLDVKTSAEQKPRYFRFVDDSQDRVVKYENQTLITLTGIDQENPIANPWGKTPAIIVSDLMHFDDLSCFGSPLSFIVELADCYLRDRSIRDLQKKYHGFAKAVEPLMKCSTCEGTGVTKGSACPDCTPAGASTGSGYKLRTKVSDVAKFPIDILENSNFDFKKIFGFVAPDIETWNKQDSSLEDLEGNIYRTYWGVEMEGRTAGGRMSPTGSSNMQETATKTIANLQPKYARLSATADWAEKLENIIATFVGKLLFPEFKESQITYGRNWILETPANLLQQYYESRTKGVPDFILNEMLDRYIRAHYQNSPVQMAKYLKLMEVEPFLHIDAKFCLPPGSSSTSGCVVIPTMDDYLAKIYFGEWCSTLTEAYILMTKTDKLKSDLFEYCDQKEIEEAPAAQTPPAPLPGTPEEDGKPEPKED
jgi:hypothetical protein